MNAAVQETMNATQEAINAAAQEAVKYFYVIHGTIPELMPIVAFRREGKEKLYERKILRCPICGNRLSDTSSETRVELYKHPFRVEVKCQFYIKCDVCHGEIGINVA